MLAFRCLSSINNILFYRQKLIASKTNRQATKAAVQIFLTGLLSGLSGRWATILDNAHPCCLRAFAFIADNNKQILAFSQIVNAAIAK